MIKEPEAEKALIKNITPEGEFYEGDPAPLIVVKQLPVIEERLKTIKQVAEAKVADALALICTEENLVAVKEARAALRKDFQNLEDTRKMIKKAVLAPLENFEAEYKKYVTEVFGPADKELKERIEEVETALKDEKKAEIAAYFYEYLESKGIDFVSFEDTHINVTRSASNKSLMEQAKAFVDRICEDLSIIELQENKDEVLYVYKNRDSIFFLNASQAIQYVVQKNKAIAEAKVKEAERKEQQEAQQKAAEKVEAVVEALAPPTVEEPTETEVQKVYEASFKVSTYDLEKIKKLIAFMNKEGIEYEQL